MKYISHVRVNIIKQAINRAIDSEMGLVDDAPFGSDEFHVGVNWSALGTQDAKKTMSFAQDLTALADLSNYINDLHYTVSYDADPGITSREEAQEQGERLLRWMKERAIGDVKCWIRASYYEKEEA